MSSSRICILLVGVVSASSPELSALSCLLSVGIWFDFYVSDSGVIYYDYFC